MKKVFALFGSLLVFAGIKAQTTPAVKKETSVPATQTVKPNVQNVSIKNSGASTLKKTDKAIKVDYIKKTNAVPLKDNQITKPGKF